MNRHEAKRRLERKEKENQYPILPIGTGLDSIEKREYKMLTYEELKKIMFKFMKGK